MALFNHWNLQEKKISTVATSITAADKTSNPQASFSLLTKNALVYQSEICILKAKMFWSKEKSKKCNFAQLLFFFFY